MSIFNIGKEFSRYPSGRFYSDGESSGEFFREKFLKPKISKLSENEVLTIILDDGVETFGSSFLVAGFAGMVKYGYITGDELLKQIEFKVKDPDYEFYKNRILQYVNEAKYNSDKYISTSN